MFNWNVEELKLFNQKNGIFFGKEKIYSCEHKVSREDKIVFVDKMQDKKLSYLLDRMEKTKQDCNFDTITSEGKKAWLYKNDPLFMFPLNSYGRTEFLGIKIDLFRNNKTWNGAYDDLVNEAFHRQLKLCEAEEKQWFEAHDEYCVLRTELRNKILRHSTTFGVNIGDCSDGTLNVMGETWKQSRELTLEELKELDKKYDELDAVIARLTAETKIKY